MHLTLRSLVPVFCVSECLVMVRQIHKPVQRERYIWRVSNLQCAQALLEQVPSTKYHNQVNLNDVNHDWLESTRIIVTFRQAFWIKKNIFYQSPIFDWYEIINCRRLFQGYLTCKIKYTRLQVQISRKQIYWPGWGIRMYSGNASASFAIKRSVPCQPSASGYDDHSLKWNAQYLSVWFFSQTIGNCSRRNPVSPTTRTRRQEYHSLNKHWGVAAQGRSRSSPVTQTFLLVMRRKSAEKGQCIFLRFSCAIIGICSLFSDTLTDVFQTTANCNPKTRRL